MIKQIPKVRVRITHLPLPYCTVKQMFPTNGGPQPRRAKSGNTRDCGGGSDHRVPPPLQVAKEKDTTAGYDAAYFRAYSRVGVHEEMIKDRVRVEAYRDAIFYHKKQIAGKVVVDVGCGTGILSIFCAQAGARRVYAVDASDIALQADKVVKANNLSDTIIVLHGRVEDVKIEDKVDVIISEWMGYILLYESMLGSVITARDKWLKPGGLILPSYATLYMAPVSNPDRYGNAIDFWRDVYGIDMSAMMPLAKHFAFQEPSVETIYGENVLTRPHVVKHINCSTVTIQELESVNTEFELSTLMRGPFNGFGFWFDVEFGDALILNTAPDELPTHWQQTIVYFYNPVEVEQDQVIKGSATLSQSKENPRFMNIHLEYTTNGRSFVKQTVMQ